MRTNHYKNNHKNNYKNDYNFSTIENIQKELRKMNAFLRKATQLTTRDIEQARKYYIFSMGFLTPVDVSAWTTAIKS